MKTSLRPGKIEGRSENVVNMKSFQVYKIILRPYQVLITFTPRPCQVLTTSIRFPMSLLPRVYHDHPVYSTLILRSQHDQSDLTTSLSRFQRVLTALLLLLLLVVVVVVVYRTYFTTTSTNIFNSMSLILIDRGK